MPAESPSNEVDGAVGDASLDASIEKKDECSGTDIGNIEEILLKSECEETVTAGGVPTVDLKGKLEITAFVTPRHISPGGKANLLVTFTNETNAPLTLHFRIDPLPRFETETYNARNKRVDVPPGKSPRLPKGQSPPPVNDARIARLTIGPSGAAHAVVPWDAVKMKWVPDKVRGTPRERGFHRSPAGALPKGKYTVKIGTPLVGVSDSVDHAPKIRIDLGGRRP
ncbi:MAG: hypothetical protein FWD69_11675 [Polyangiaceae bacterium]|nr:hypothetical protein [Polyangiaceae bacterium]